MFLSFTTSVLSSKVALDERRQFLHRLGYAFTSEELHKKGKGREEIVPHWTAPSSGFFFVRHFKRSGIG
jgi:hypothetical protein